MPSRLLNPELIADGKLTSEHIKQWREEGYLLINGLIPDTLAQQAALGLAENYKGKVASTAGLGGLLFPCVVDPINDITVYPSIIDAVKQLLDTDEIRLSQSDAWGKDGVSKESEAYKNRTKMQNYDQRVHCDYPNHMFVHPPQWNEVPHAVSAIIYYSEATECGGETGVIPHSSVLAIDKNCEQKPITRMPGVGNIAYINDREKAEEVMKVVAPAAAEFRSALYAAEQHVNYNVGTVLLYRQDMWHRGRPIHEGKRRFVQNLTFRTREAEWVGTWNPGWATDLYGLAYPERKVERFIAALSHEQRTVLGFPAPGSVYWTAYTLQAVAARFSAFNFDMKPYEQAFADKVDARINEKKKLDNDCADTVPVTDEGKM